MINIYLNFDDDLLDYSKIREEHYKTSVIKVTDDQTDTGTYNFIINKDTKTWIYENDKDKPKERGLGEFIDDGFQKREVEPTTNNPDSSRSHVVLCVTFIDEKTRKEGKLIVCDLAGVENKFDCTNPEVLRKMDSQYATKSGKYNEYHDIVTAPRKINLTSYLPCRRPITSFFRLDWAMFDLYSSKDWDDNAMKMEGPKI